MLGDRARAGEGGGMGELVDLLLGLRGGAVLGPPPRLLALPPRAGLAYIRPDEDGVALWAPQARLGPAVYVQRSGGVAAGLGIRGQRHCDGVEARGLLRTPAMTLGS